MKEVSKAELAKFLKVSAPMISKYVKKGVLDKCFTKNGKKLYLEKAVEAIELSKMNNFNKVSKVITPQEIKNDEELYTDDSIQELDNLISQAKSPSQKVQIVKDFWIGKINRQKFLQEEGELISVKDAKIAIETLLTPLNRYLDDFGNNIKNHFPDISIEVVDWINEENNRQKEQLRLTDWES